MGFVLSDAATIWSLSPSAASDGNEKSSSVPVIDRNTPGFSASDVLRRAPPTPKWEGSFPGWGCIKNKKPTPKNTPITQAAISPTETRYKVGPRDLARASVFRMIG